MEAPKNCQMNRSLSSGTFNPCGSIGTENGLVRFIFNTWITCTVVAAVFKAASGVRASWCWSLIPVKADWASSLAGSELGSGRMSGRVLAKVTAEVQLTGI